MTAPTTRSDLGRYPRPSLTVDVALLTVASEPVPSLRVLLVRPDSPTDGDVGRRWRLPGTFVREHERLADAVRRVLRTKAAISGASPRQLHVFDDPARDDRGWVVSVAHTDTVPAGWVTRRGEGHDVALAAVEDHDGELVAAVDGERVPLPFDHDEILGRAVADLRHRYAEAADPAGLLDEPFTVNDLRLLHVAVLGEELNKDTFRRQHLHQLRQVAEEPTRGRVGRPATLFARASTHDATRGARRDAPRDAVTAEVRQAPVSAGVSVVDGSRASLVEFWDERIDAWIAGDQELSGDLKRWALGYQGTGSGSLDLSCYPDPYVGDLAGVRGEPRLVVLGLNPGVGYPELQSSTGAWARRIAAAGYSRCFDRAPYGDPAWLALHGKESPSWNRLMNFARAWTRDQALRPDQLLNMELLPFHSTTVTATITPPPDVLRRYVWGPLAEVDVPVLLAFGKPWLTACQSLGLRAVAHFGSGPGLEPLADATRGGWEVVAFGLPSGQRVLVSFQRGYAGPPGPKNLDELRRVASAVT